MRISAIASDSRRADLSFDRRDNARGMPKAVVIDEAVTWGDDRRPRFDWTDTIIYEAHVKGLTQIARGRAAGMARHLSRPFGAIDDRASQADGRHRDGTSADPCLYRRSHAGRARTAQLLGLQYDRLFCAGAALCHATMQIASFRNTVARLHDAGIEVILDVVYNHTAEGNHLGPTLSFRGIDNQSYYWLMPDEPRYYENFTGTGNALNLTHPRVLQMVMDSLRYWVTAFHVDGFRFDLASTLGRLPHGFDPMAPFFAAIRQDRLLTTVKMIAEPWDIGLGGYQVGNFPRGWSEWNDVYRHTLRNFWRGEPNHLGDLARRMSGSSDLFRHTRRSPRASINHVTVHDGFTLADLVSATRPSTTRRMAKTTATAPTTTPASIAASRGRRTIRTINERRIGWNCANVCWRR